MGYVNTIVSDFQAKLRSLIVEKNFINPLGLASLSNLKKKLFSVAYAFSLFEFLWLHK